MRAFTGLWERVCTERYGVTDPKLRRFRYGVQVNSLGLTEAQPENNVPRIVLESLGGDPVQAGPGPGHPAPGLERGARAAASLGPAVVAAHPADPGLRVGPPRVRRHLRRLGGHREEDGRGGRGVVGRAGERAGPGRGVRGHRRAEGPAGGQPGRAGPAHRDRRAAGGRGQLLHRDGRIAAGPGKPAGTDGQSGRARSCGSIRRWSRSCGPTWRRGGPPAIRRRSGGPSTS